MTNIILKYLVLLLMWSKKGYCGCVIKNKSVPRYMSRDYPSFWYYWNGCVPRSVFIMLLRPFADTCRAAGNWGGLMHHSPQMRLNKGPQPPGFSSHTVNKWPHRVLSAMFFTFLCFLAVILLFKMPSECSA